MAASIKHIEWTLELCKTYISTNISTYLAAITVEKADGLSLPAPLATSYAINELDAISQYPFIQFVPDMTDTELPGGTWDEDEHEIIIKVHNVAKEGTIEKCAKRSYRYARAISEIIIDNRSMGDQVISWFRRQINYTPMMTDGTGFKQEIWIECSVRHHGQA